MPVSICLGLSPNKGTPPGSVLEATDLPEAARIYFGTLSTTQGGSQPHRRWQVPRCHGAAQCLQLGSVCLGMGLAWSSASMAKGICGAGPHTGLHSGAQAACQPACLWARVLANPM